MEYSSDSSSDSSLFRRTFRFDSSSSSASSSSPYQNLSPNHLEQAREQTRQDRLNHVLVFLSNYAQRSAQQGMDYVTINLVNYNCRDLHNEIESFLRSRRLYSEWQDQDTLYMELVEYSSDHSSLEDDICESSESSSRSANRSTSRSDSQSSNQSYVSDSDDYQNSFCTLTNVVLFGALASAGYYYYSEAFVMEVAGTVANYVNHLF